MPTKKPAKKPVKKTTATKPAKKPARVRREPSPPTVRALGLTALDLEGRKPILYWTDTFDPNLFVDRADAVPATRRRATIAKLKRGKVFQQYRGMARCRVCGKRVGSADVANTEWIWPQGAEHYIVEHGVWFPLLDAFAPASRKVAEPAPAPAPARRSRKKVEEPAPAPARRSRKKVEEPAPAPARRSRATADRYPVLGGGLIESKDSGQTKRRPFVVVRVSAEKVRPFYMSTGTGGETEAGEWNLFGGIASGSRLGWFIKPPEGKRVAKYADIASFLTEKFSDNATEAWRRIRAAVPAAKVYALHERGSLPADRVERRRLIMRKGGELNRYLVDLDAIAPFEEQEAVWEDRSPGTHVTVHRAARAAPAPAPAPEPAPAPARRRSRATAEPEPAPAPAPSRRRSGASAGFPTGGVMLAKKHERGDVRGWWMSEKFDGMRAYWTGSEFFSRNGNKIYAPKWFTDALPDMALDGELMLGRGKFQETMSIVRKHTPVDKDWRRITYYVFDAPMERGGCEARWDAAKRAVRGVGHVKMVEQVACKSPAHLKQVHDEIAALGGEGVMLREPGSAYENRRSGRLLKVKMFDDNEARITGYEAGKGKHAGRLGAYEAVLTTGPHKGKSFTVGTGMSDEERERPLRIGTIITVKHQGYSNSGHPRFPSFLRVRGRE